jgi:glycerol uptake facilitator-like aquaporin
MFTSIFISVILHTKYPITTSTNDGVLGALAIAITLATVAGTVGASSGGCFNPTIGLTETTIMMIINPTLESSSFKYSIVYIFGPLLGGILAAFYIFYIAFRVPVGKEYEMMREVSYTVQG